MNKDLHVFAFFTTALVHAAVISLFLVMGQHMGCQIGGDHGFKLDDARYIEAALAKKGPEEKERQPQKRRRPKVKPPDVPSADRDEKKQVEQKKPKKEKPKPKPEDIDWMSQLEKNRKLADDLPEHGTDLPDLGNVDGSEWGTEADARGDPYVGELKGRIFKAWKLPTLVAEEFSAVGCVRLDAKGRIKVRELLEASKNPKVDQSVKQALKNATDMEAPVPAHLRKLLTEQGICFKFHS